ncbi:hypothetical protein KV580_17850 [Pseudomonas chlororaphis]|nr:hypothetical protein [Pseudomonas chlororaphis]
MSIDIRRGIRLSLVLVWLFVSGLAQAITGPETAQPNPFITGLVLLATAGTRSSTIPSKVFIWLTRAIRTSKAPGPLSRDDQQGAMS